MRENVTPRGRLAWNLILLNAVLVLAAAVLGALPAGDGGGGVALTRQLLAGVALTVAWLAAIRFILLDTWGRWFWLVCLAGSLALTLTVGTAGMVAGIAISGLVLIFRFYSPWRLISARKRALGFGMGLVSLVLLVFANRFWGLDASDGGFVSRVRCLGGWSVGSLYFFWFGSVFHLAIRMRLHFLRIRPKLAVSGLLIGLAPLLLVGLLGVMVLYLGLGGARATRAENMLESWRQAAVAGVDLAGAPFDTNFAWPSRDGMTGRGEPIDAPGWIDELAAALEFSLVTERARSDSLAAASVDTVGWFLMDRRIWLMDWRGVGSQDVSTRAWLLGETPLEHLSYLLKAGVHLQAVDAEETEDGIEVSPASEETEAAFPGIKSVYRDVSGEQGFWNEFAFFGSTFFEVVTVRDRELSTRTIFLNLRARWTDLKTEFLEGEDNVNILVVVALGLVAGLFLILEIFALFFGVRITEGIIAAVHTLRKGTQALGAGDLDTVIELPNEDEFGDLADSFNEMTVAVKKGREDALAREALTRELANARAIQERLLPAEEPRVAGFQVTGASIPSREIGGDYFDFLVQDDEHLGVAIGDVSGKGMPAALLMSNLQASLHGQVLHPSSVSGIVERVNNLIVQSTDPHMFATFFYGVLDLKAGTFTSTNAGHNPPLVLRNNGEIETLGAGGLLLGMLPDQEYKQETVELAPGEVVVMYTDGISEAVGPSAEEDDPEAMFGEEALAEVVKRSAHLPAVGIKEAVLDAVAEHTSGVPQSDDITLVVVRRQG